MNNKEEMKNAFEDIFSSIISNSENETKTNYSEIIKKLINSGYDIENPDVFNVMVDYRLKQILGIVITEICASPKNINNLNAIKFLYLDYTFMKCNIENLIIKREGSCCCADKSKHILEAYKDYLIRGFVPELNNQRNYWVFNFGGYQDWFELCEGLFHLYYGNPTKYLVAYQKLINSELRNQEE